MSLSAFAVGALACVAAFLLLFPFTSEIAAAVRAVLVFRPLRGAIALFGRLFLVATRAIGWSRTMIAAFRKSAARPICAIAGAAALAAAAISVAASPAHAGPLMREPGDVLYQPPFAIRADGRLALPPGMTPAEAARAYAGPVDYWAATCRATLAKKPRSLRRPLPASPTYDRHGADDKQAPNVALSHLRGFSENLLSAGRMLPWNDPEPGRKISAAFEMVHRRREGLDRHGCDRPTPGIVCRRRVIAPRAASRAVAFSRSAILFASASICPRKIRDSSIARSGSEVVVSSTASASIFTFAGPCGATTSCLGVSRIILLAFDEGFDVGSGNRRTSWPNALIARPQ
jgi:hypothetical protein